MEERKQECRKQISNAENLKSERQSDTQNQKPTDHDTRSMNSYDLQQKMELDENQYTANK